MALVGSGDLIPLTITGTGFVAGALVNFGSNILIPVIREPDNHTGDGAGGRVDFVYTG